MSTFDTSSASVRTRRGGRQYALAGDPAPADTFCWLSRPRRVLLVLAAVWVINVFDLGYTLLESLHHDFVERNPVAARLMGTSPAVLVSYKTALLMISSAILLIFRRHRVAELGCWFLLTTYLYVAICWVVYYEHRLTTLQDPTVHADALFGCCLP